MTTTLSAHRDRQRTRAGVPVPRPARTPVLLELAGHAASREATVAGAVNAAREALCAPDATEALAAWAGSLGWQDSAGDLIAALVVAAPSPAAVAASLYRAARGGTP